LENNASSAGVKLGGLFNTAEIRILICYILASVDEPVPANMLVNTLHYEGIANAFEVSDAIVSLTQTDHIKLFEEKEDSYIITDKGRDTAETLKTSLSLTVKERALAATIKMLSRFKNAKETKFETIKENDNTYLSCSVIDGDLPFMTIKLLLSDEQQAELIKERFLDNPTEFYRLIIEKLTK